MIQYYIDTSALVKVYHSESGTGEMLRFYKEKKLLAISELAKIELISTVYRKYRENEITKKTLNAIIEKFEYDCYSRYKILNFSSLVIDEAFTLLRRFADKRGLKTLDSLQLSFFKIYCDERTIFVCSDSTLEKLVRIEGFSTLLPIN